MTTGSLEGATPALRKPPQTTVTRRALKQATVRGLVHRNVAEGASLPRLRRKETESLSRGGNEAAQDGPRRPPRSPLHPGSDLRPAPGRTVLGLRWEDINLEARTLKVRRQLQRSRDSSGLIVVPTKNNKSRVIRLGAATVAALKVHRECQAEQIASL